MDDTDQGNVIAFTLLSLVYQREHPVLQGWGCLTTLSWITYISLTENLICGGILKPPLYQPSPFASFCDLTQIMTRAPVSDKIWDVNTLYIAYTPIIIYSPHPCNYICIHIVVGYAWKCTEWLLTRTEENMWVRLNVLKLVHQAEILFTIVHSVWQIVLFAWTDGWHQATRTSLAYDRRSVKRK